MRSSGKGQARMGKGWPLRQKVLKLKPLHRAYTKVGCHLPPPPKVYFYSTNGQTVARGGKWMLEEVCRVTMGHIRVTVGHLRVTIDRSF